MVQDKMKIGDKVSVIDEDLSGTVTSVHGKKVVFIDEHGFTHQFPTEKLVVQNLELYDGINIQHKKETSKPVSKKTAKICKFLIFILKNWLKIRQITILSNAFLFKRKNYSKNWITAVKTI